MNARTPRFTGVIPPVVTPLTADGEIDTASLERLVGFLVEGGVTGLFALGSSGETAYLTDTQKDVVVDTIVGATAGQVPVVVGTIEQTTNRAIERAKAALKSGADAVVATAPFYTRTHETEIDRHFRLLADAVDLPLLAYDVPVCVHSKLSTDLVLRLAADGVIAGIKDSSGDDVGLRYLCLGARELPDFSVLTGHEVVVDAMLLGGADGAVPGLGNVDPHGYARLDRLAAAGDWTAAKAEQDRIARLFEIVTVAAPGTASATAGGLGAFKTALKVRGIIDTNVVSPPMRPLDAAETARIAEILERAGLR
ncbi:MULTISPECIES: dihydrodipicolinate synthase family protein [unclassified Streptomyces]|uniref:dihydrodipicolinate synthase family protein n=1 Tax=unclassified Streptomyces TaxID=2593676 RepID=UPI0029670560|nr:dihydrodipicolinate synthase family protein [Streptomyces sp. SJL17-1]